jgi:hypothetical protein
MDGAAVDDAAAEEAALEVAASVSIARSAAAAEIAAAKAKKEDAENDVSFKAVLELLQSQCLKRTAHPEYVRAVVMSISGLLDAMTAAEVAEAKAQPVQGGDGKGEGEGKGDKHEGAGGAGGVFRSHDAYELLVPTLVSFLPNDVQAALAFANSGASANQGASAYADSVVATPMADAAGETVQGAEKGKGADVSSDTPSVPETQERAHERERELQSGRRQTDPVLRARVYECLGSIYPHTVHAANPSDVGDPCSVGYSVQAATSAGVLGLLCSPYGSIPSGSLQSPTPPAPAATGAVCSPSAARAAPPSTGFPPEPVWSVRAAKLRGLSTVLQKIYLPPDSLNTGDGSPRKQRRALQRVGLLSSGALVRMVLPTIRAGIGEQKYSQIRLAAMEALLELVTREDAKLLLLPHKDVLLGCFEEARAISKETDSHAVHIAARGKRHLSDW